MADTIDSTAENIGDSSTTANGEKSIFDQAQEAVNTAIAAATDAMTTAFDTALEAAKENPKTAAAIAAGAAAAVAGAAFGVSKLLDDAKTNAAAKK